MPVVLYRVDERLIHGQVIVGWGAHLRPDAIVVVDDELAQSPWEQELYGLGVPPEVEARFLSVAAAREQLPDWQQGPGRTMVLTRDVATMRRLAEGGVLAGEDVNIGGIHYAPGRRSVLPYVFLSEEESAELEKLSEDVAHVSARDLPGARKVDLLRLLEAGGWR